VKGRIGRMIAIEGTDGSGKGTQSRRLAARLRRVGIRARRIAFPRYRGSFFGRMVGAYLRGEYGPLDAVDPHLAALLYAWDRWSARDALLRWLAAGETIILDRYVDSNKAHQAARLPRGSDWQGFLSWLERLEYGVLGLPRPDFTVYLYVPPRVAYELIGRKPARPHLGGRARDLHERDRLHLVRASRLFMHLARTAPPGRASLVRCVVRGRLLSPREIAEEIWKVLGAHGLTGG